MSVKTQTATIKPSTAAPSDTEEFGASVLCVFSILDNRPSISPPHPEVIPKCRIINILQDDTVHDETTEIIYEIAATASAKQEYELAISAYDCVGDYQEARQERARNYMLWVDQMFERGEYDQYIQAISVLGDSDNTREMIRKAEYAKAKKLMENGAYEKAKTELQKLDGYEDSALLLKECEYELASKKYVQGEYQEALAAFEREQMAGYRDADTMITDCRYQIGRINEVSSNYQEAAELY